MLLAPRFPTTIEESNVQSVEDNVLIPSAHQLAILLDDWTREDHWPWNTMTMPLASIARVRYFLLHVVLEGELQVCLELEININ